MSADNGWVVMVRDNEYRVAYYNASLWYESGSEYDPDDSYRKNAWESGRPCVSRAEALEMAHNKNLSDPTEYGVVEEVMIFSTDQCDCDVHAELRKETPDA